MVTMFEVLENIPSISHLILEFQIISGQYWCMCLLIVYANVCVMLFLLTFLVRWVVLFLIVQMPFSLYV